MIGERLSCARWLPLWLALAMVAGGAEPVDEAANWFQAAHGFVLAGDQERAVERFKALVRHFPKSDWAPKAQLEIAQLLARNREFGDAFDAAQKLIEKHPGSDAFTKAMEIQFAVAERVAEEYRRRRLKNDRSQRDLPDRQTASQMLRAILANARYTELAPKAHYRLAVSLDEERQPAEALRELNSFLDHYPDHELAEDAAFQIAFIDYRLSREGRRERGAGERARLAFEDFLIRHPASEKAPEARYLLATLSKWESERLLETARFYEKRGEVDAALRTYRGALQNDPSAENAAQLTAKIKQLQEAGAMHRDP